MRETWAGSWFEELLVSEEKTDLVIELLRKKITQELESICSTFQQQLKLFILLEKLLTVVTNKSLTQAI